MKFLILGGTRFLGRTIVEVALERGHELTLFNRGRTNPQLFPEVEKLHGDRDGELEPLDGRHWDAVIDTSGYVPRVVRQSAELLSGTVDHYTFISSVSVYADLAEPGIDEEYDLATMDDASVEEVTNETYGPLKVLCEEVVQEEYPDGALIVRPGYIVGPYDPTDRFTYWPHRVDRGGEMLCPGEPGVPLQFIDVRDLAEWIVRMVEAGESGVYNAVGPESPVPLGDLLAVCREVSGSDVTFTWVPEDFLREQGVDLEAAFPIWVPRSSPEAEGLHAVDAGKAVAAGLTYRPVEETVRATLAWDREREQEGLGAGLSRSREDELLDAWHSR